MHPFSILTLGIFVAGYITARWDLVTRLYELAIFAADHGVVVRSIDPSSSARIHVADAPQQTRAAKGFALLSIGFSFFIIPAHYLATRETTDV